LPPRATARREGASLRFGGSIGRQPRIVREPGSDVVGGGLWALSLWGSFYIALVIVPQGGRGRGMGSELMRQAEAEARRQGCRDMWLDTFAFQARPFYERLGFEVFGQLDGPAPAFPRWFMRKALL
jgi:GNAT superfamily N-acetyltransferase